METRPIIRDEYLNATRSVETAVEEWAGSECVCARFILEIFFGTILEGRLRHPATH